MFVVLQIRTLSICTKNHLSTINVKIQATSINITNLFKIVITPAIQHIKSNIQSLVRPNQPCTRDKTSFYDNSLKINPYHHIIVFSSIQQNHHHHYTDRDSVTDFHLLNSNQQHSIQHRYQLISVSTLVTLPLIQRPNHHSRKLSTSINNESIRCC